MNYICKFCGFPCKNIRCFTNHLRSHKVDNEEYYNNFLKTDKDNSGVCFCGKTTKFYGLNVGYAKFCSNSCSRKSKETQNKVKQTNKEKYGIENYNNREKAKNTCKLKYKCDTVWQAKTTKNKIKQTNLNKFGCEFATQSPIIREKIENTCIKKYGVKTPLKNAEVKEKIKKTNIKLYGTSNPNHNHFYVFDNINFDSSYELVYYIWLKDHNIDFEYQPNVKFEYYYNGFKNYYPDFLVEDNYVELKGLHFFENRDETKKMINPYDRTQDDFFEAKHQCMIKYEVTIITNVNKYIKYVRQKYGKNFIKNCIKRKNE